FNFSTESWNLPDICHAAIPDVIDKSERDIDAIGRQDAILNLEIGRTEEELAADSPPPDHSALDAIATSDHTTRQIDASRSQQATNHSRADAVLAQLNFRNFGSVES